MSDELKPAALLLGSKPFGPFVHSPAEVAGWLRQNADSLGATVQRDRQHYAARMLLALAEGCINADAEIAALRKRAEEAATDAAREGETT